MPVYEFRCESAESPHSFDLPLTFSRFEAVEKGEEGVLCAECGEPARPVFNPQSVAFSLKEGESGGWVSKSMKESKYRAWRGQEMARRSKEHVRPNDLVPNHQGVCHDKWSDIRDHVHSTAGAAAASTYDALVAKEQKK